MEKQPDLKSAGHERPSCSKRKAREEVLRPRGIERIRALPNCLNIYRSRLLSSVEIYRGAFPLVLLQWTTRNAKAPQEILIRSSDEDSANKDGVLTKVPSVRTRAPVDGSR